MLLSYTCEMLKCLFCLMKGFPRVKLTEAQAYRNPLFVDRYTLIEVG